ncbi:hypothetical protein DNH61_24680 [Paenibacillus sambharensis]|uniref:Leucine-rich repeat domain-containing protein n=1 Tax=Paenibacillus sambharensis TaxID=1803190 RepID=A0A2W1LMW2_9BACL|nr:hypothetical protein [Paenibacillus sambharensis]PZD93131.1 hypothetical protein DNH61_24680 [Paenibacillus sambharensis]
MEHWRQNTIWFEQIPNDQFIQLDLKKEKLTNHNIQDIEYLALWYHKNKTRDLSNIPASSRLLYLELNWSNIHNLNAIDRYSNLKRLELHYCTKLQNDSGLSNISKTLEHLHINQSKKLEISVELLSLKNLRVLCLNDCGQLENLTFLKEFPNLIDFRFVNTSVLDGDLVPIVEHPTLRTVGYLNKRHYNIRENELESKLKEKGSNNYKEVIYRDENSTFKYLD